MIKSNQPPYKNFFNKDKEKIANYIRNHVEKATGQSMYSMRSKYPHIKVYRIALFHIATTNKAICRAIGIDIASGTEYKRELEKRGVLTSSTHKKVCPYSGYKAHVLTTNPDKFNEINDTKKSTQLLLSW